MVGKIKKVDEGKGYGFIQADKADYFFHRDSFEGHWKDLCDDVAHSDTPIEVEFEPTRTSKGLRAESVTRTDGGVNR
jgi:cold shock CspA family protein